MPPEEQLQPEQGISQEDLTADEAAAALAMVTRLSEDFLRANAPQSPKTAPDEEPGGEIDREPAEKERGAKQPELDTEAIKNDLKANLSEEIRSAIKAEVSDLRKDLMAMLEEDGETEED